MLVSFTHSGKRLLAERVDRQPVCCPHTLHHHHHRHHHRPGASAPLARRPTGPVPGCHWKAMPLADVMVRLSPTSTAAFDKERPHTPQTRCERARKAAADGRSATTQEPSHSYAPGTGVGRSSSTRNAASPITWLSSFPSLPPLRLRVLVRQSVPIRQRRQEQPPCRQLRPQPPLVPPAL